MEEDFSLDDILKSGHDLSTGQEFLDSLESYDEAMREIHRPLTNDEKGKVKDLVNEIESCLAAPEDAFLINKLIDAFQILAGSANNLSASLNAAEEGDEIPQPGMMIEENPALREIYFRLGMAYERLKAKGII